VWTRSIEYGEILEERHEKKEWEINILKNGKRNCIFCQGAKIMFWGVFSYEVIIEIG
jgi:hypothetical protein